MLEFLKAPFLVLHFSVYTLMIFLIVLSVILLSMLVILLSTLSVTRHRICDKNYSRLLNLNLNYETLRPGVGSGLMISILGRMNLFRLDALITLVVLMWKRMGLLLRKNYLLRYWGRLSSTNWNGTLSLSLLLKLPPINLKHSMKYLPPTVFLYLYKSTIQPCMEYCCHTWVGVPSCYLEMLDKLQKRLCRTVDSSLAVSLEPLALSKCNQLIKSLL